MELKVLQVRKKSDEEHNLPIGPFRFSQCERSERLREMSKIPLNLRHEARNIQVFYVEFLDVSQCAEFASGPVVESPRRKYRPIFTGDKYPRDKGEETKPGCPPEWVGPLGFSRLKETRNSSGKSAIEMRYSGDVPGARDEGACLEAAGVVDEIVGLFMIALACPKVVHLYRTYLRNRTVIEFVRYSRVGDFNTFDSPRMEDPSHDHCV